MWVEVCKINFCTNTRIKEKIVEMMKGKTKSTVLCEYSKELHIANCFVTQHHRKGKLTR